jgi:hypothetical protein
MVEIQRVRGATRTIWVIAREIQTKGHARHQPDTMTHHPHSMEARLSVEDDVISIS